MARALRKRSRKRADRGVPGPSPNPATNLLIIDIAARGAVLLAARALEQAALKARYGRAKAGEIVKGRSTVASLAATGAARVATRSLPGFLLVTGGLLAKTLIDRSLRPRDARQRGDRKLARRAEKADATTKS
jgi:hypothetical protein